MTVIIIDHRSLSTGCLCVCQSTIETQALHRLAASSQSERRVTLLVQQLSKEFRITATQIGLWCRISSKDGSRPVGSRAPVVCCRLDGPLASQLIGQIGVRPNKKQLRPFVLGAGWFACLEGVLADGPQPQPRLNSIYHTRVWLLVVVVICSFPCRRL